MICLSIINKLIYQIAQFNQLEHQQYEESLKQYRDLKNIINTAKEETREEGREEGVYENQKETVLNLNSSGSDLNFISKITKLKIEKIKDILSKNKV